ncbi:MAG: hypothetical protein O3C40_03205 [Planctomycetota bacterium]|nr:hypothetical protein [Planctomycetota bacterium]
MSRNLSWLLVRRVVVLQAMASLIALTPTGKAWASVGPIDLLDVFPRVLGDTGAGSNPRVIRTIIAPYAITRYTYEHGEQSADERDGNGIGKVWDDNETDELTELIQHNGIPQFTLTAVEGECWYHYTQVDYSADGFISHWENERTGEGYFMDIQGTLDPFVNGTCKLSGYTEEFVCDSDQTMCLDTYIKDLVFETEFPGRKEGYELWQLETTCGIEWTRTEYWVGFAEDPPHFWGPQSRTTSGITELTDAADATEVEAVPNLPPFP